MEKLENIHPGEILKEEFIPRELNPPITWGKSHRFYSRDVRSYAEVYFY